MIKEKSKKKECKNLKMIVFAISKTLIRGYRLDITLKELISSEGAPWLSITTLIKKQFLIFFVPLNYYTHIFEDNDYKKIFSSQ